MFSKRPFFPFPPMFRNGGVCPDSDDDMLFNGLVADHPNRVVGALDSPSPH